MKKNLGAFEQILVLSDKAKFAFEQRKLQKLPKTEAKTSVPKRKQV